MSAQGISGGSLSGKRLSSVYRVTQLSSSMLEIALLGRFELRLDGQLLHLGSRPQQKLLAFLVLNAGRSVSRIKLASIMWLDSPESTARKNLRHHLWRLRQAIGEEYLLTSRSTVAFSQVAGYRLDVDRLTGARDEDNTTNLIEAAAVYDGELLPGFYDDWVQLEREHLQAIFERCMQRLLDQLSAESRWVDLLTWSEHWIAQAQTPEPAYRALMVGCFGLDDLAGVAMNYWRCRKTLEESLGVEPSAETESLYLNLTKKGRPASVEGHRQPQDIATTEDPGLLVSSGALLNADWLRAALADLNSGDERTLDRFSQLVQDWPRSGGINGDDRLTLAREIRSLAAQRSISTAASDRLLRLINEDIFREPGQLPDFLAAGSPELVPPLFVGREGELDRLLALMDPLRRNQGQIHFVAGDVGSGKTSLLNAFTIQLAQAQQDALVGWGPSNAFGGRGDPYLPFRKALSMLVGDMEQSWWSGHITTSQAHRLWQGMPAVADILVDYGSDLLDALVPSQPLLNRLATAYPAGHPTMDKIRKVATRDLAGGQSESSQLFEQVAVTLRQIAKDQPVVLLLDDLQWADRASLELLFHLSRSLSGARILIIGAYRPDETGGREGQLLRSILAEFRRTFGDIFLDLNRSSGTVFIDALIDSEPNRLDQHFRDSLYGNTAGHPLFTVELLRDMQQTGFLVQDNSGHWTAKPSLDWRLMPVRVDGAIESRLNRLNQELREILTVAAVEGETFSVQVASRVSEIDEWRLSQILSQDLQNHYRLVREDRVESRGQQRLNHYRFVHQLFQRYLYTRLSPSKRREVHGQVGQALEQLHEIKDDELVNRLAWHFEEAGIGSKAADYLLMAGDRARSLFAHQAAADHYQRALQHLQLLGDDERLARTWMRLGLTYHNDFDYRRSRQAYDQAFKFWGKMSLPSGEPLGGATLRLWQLEPITLDPTSEGDDDTGIWLIQLFSGLVALSDDKVVVPDVAARWETSDGGRTYTFRLREDARWSDGQPVTAHDFIHAWKRRLDPAAHEVDAERFFDIKGARSYHQGRLAEEQQLGLRAPDNLTLVVELERPTSYFLYLLAAPYAFPVPSHVIKGLGNNWARPQNIVSNGPYQILDWSSEKRVVLGRNPFYHGVFRGNVSQVEVSLLKSQLGWEEAMEQYLRGQIDFLDVCWFPVNTVKRAQRRYGEFYTKLNPRPTTFSIGFYDQQLPFGDVRVRRALALAIDQEQLISDLQKDDAIPALGGYVPPGLPGHAADIGLPYDPVRARRLLAEAGYPDGRGFPISEIVWFDFPSLRETAEYISQLWSDVLDLNIRPVFLALPEIMAAYRNGLPLAIFSGGWSADYHDPDCFLRLGLRASIREHRPILDRIEIARNITDQEKRLLLYQDIDKMVIDEAICIPLYYGEFPAFFGPRVRKISPDFRWSDFIIDPD